MSITLGSCIILKDTIGAKLHPINRDLVHIVQVFLMLSLVKCFVFSAAWKLDEGAGAWIHFNFSRRHSLLRCSVIPRQDRQFENIQLTFEDGQSLNVSFV